MNELASPLGMVALPTPLFLLLAMAAEAYLGGMGRLFGFIPHPADWTARLVRSLDRKLNRENRSTVDRAMRGLLVVVVVLAVAFALGWLISRFARVAPFGWIIELILLIALIDQRSTFDKLRRIAGSLEKGGLAGGRKALAALSGRASQHLDEHGVARVAIETGTAAFLRGVAAPAFWYLLFGLPGLLICRALEILDRELGHRVERYRAFGLVAARMDDVIAFMPARLAALILVLAALFVPKASPGKAFATMLRDGAKHRAFNAGRPLGAMAGALDLALAGPRRFRESVSDDAWIGKGRARAVPTDVRLAAYQFAVSCLITAAIVAGLAVLWFV